MADKARRRLRSSTVILGGMGALAAALTSCGSEPDKRCVDRNSYDAINGYRVVDAKNCSGGGSSSGSTSSGGTSSGSYGQSGRNGGLGKQKQSTDGQWYYGPDKTSGRFADNGTFSKAQAVDRGGFGCSGSGGSGGSHGRIGG
ncbi:hypothetical protein AB0D04_08310 [Streptomyces sp. NPDC048483]|uniref:hypothetical protein n=1 Tax=Streptomyces sp. NPDC048483 TaxID=3154927 RepID=UPI003415108D